MRPDTLGVVGLGAVGGSLAWQAARAGVRVLGWTPAPREGVAAVKAGAVFDLVQRVPDLIRRADLVVFAAPPGANVDLLHEHGRALGSRGALATDVTSVQQPVTARAAALGLENVFAASHPLAGTHASGFAAARPDLFAGCVVYVSPVGGADAPAREIADFWKAVCAAEPVVIAAERHDAQLAWTSHLPQAVASALGGVLAASGPRGATYGSGARDTTRLAASSVAMWRDILLLNRARVLDALDAFEDRLGSLQHALREGDGAAVERWLDEARRWRTRFEEDA